MLGLSDPDKRAAAVYDVEYKMAQVQWSREEDRDVDKIYNPMTLSQLKALAPKFPWDTFFTASTIPPNGPNGERVMRMAT